MMEIYHDFVTFYVLLFASLLCVKSNVMCVVLLCKPFALYFCIMPGGTRIYYLNFYNTNEIGHEPFIRKNSHLSSNLKNAGILLFN